jgi:mono/diheme cytochrome c family protein
MIAMLTTCSFLTAASVTGLPGSQSIFINPTLYKPEKLSPDSDAGRKAYERENCASCHSIGAAGGCLAPPFDGIGAHRSRAFILARISNSPAEVKQFRKLYPHEELFERHPRLPSREAALITAYLLTVPECDAGYRVLKHTVLNDNSKIENKDSKNSDVSNEIKARDIDQGKTAFMANGCLSCHSIGNLGGHFAPALDGESKRRDRSYVQERITNAQFFIQKMPDEYGERGLVMPPANLTKKDIEQVTDFIMSLPDKVETAPQD